MPNDDLVFPCPVRRLLIRIRDEKWEVVQEHVIPSKTLPASLELPDLAPGRAIRGAWYEAVDRHGESLYRGRMRNPLQGMIEYVDDDGRLRNVPADTREVLLDVMVPDLPAVEALRFFASDKEPIRVDPGGKIETRPLAHLRIRQEAEGDDHGER